jgi:CO/xanthine dehydrogenase Mo-binding subunit
MLHAAILRSPVAHGLVATVALAIAGVHAVITAKDYVTTVPRVPLRPSSPPRPANDFGQTIEREFGMTVEHLGNVHGAPVAETSSI